MSNIGLREGEEVEFKQEWTDRALEDLAAFANTRGGKVFIGVRKNGDIVGAKADDAEIERITNVVVSRLGLTPSIQLQTRHEKEVIEIRVEPARGLVRCGGRYLRRVGNSNRDFTQEGLESVMLERSGQSWD